MPKIKIKGSIIRNDDAWLYDWFGMDYASPASLEAQLPQNSEDIDVEINSYGGDVYAGVEMYTALKNYPGNVTVQVTGIAASAASVIAMSGDKVIMSPPAQLMIHNASTITAGDYRDHDHKSNFLQKVNQSIAQAYMIKTGLQQKDLLQMMDNETFFTANEAVEKGFADEIAFVDNSAPRLTASAAMGSIIPAAVIEKFQAELQSLLKSNPGIDVNEARKTVLSGHPDPTPLADPAASNQAGQTASTKEENNLTLEELKSKYPDLYNQIISEVAASATKTERERISALNQMADKPGAADIVRNAIEQGHTVADAALAIVNNLSSSATDALKARQADAAASNAGAVPPAAAPEGEPTPEQLANQKDDELFTTALNNHKSKKTGGRE